MSTVSFAQFAYVLVQAGMNIESVKEKEKTQHQKA